MMYQHDSRLRAPNSRRKLIVSAAAIAMIGMTSLAHAQSSTRYGNDRGYRGSTISIQHGGHSGYSYDSRHSISRRAGTLRIGHRSFTIDQQNLHAKILESFKCLGYEAWCENDKVIVRVGSCPPRVRWSTGSYTARITRHGDCITIQPCARSVRSIGKHITHTRPTQWRAPLREKRWSYPGDRTRRDRGPSCRPRRGW